MLCYVSCRCGNCVNFDTKPELFDPSEKVFQYCRLKSCQLAKVVSEVLQPQSLKMTVFPYDIR